MSLRPAAHQTHRDPELVARIRSGDAAAFELLFRTYHAPLCGFAYRYLRSRETAEEAVHEVLTRVWVHRAGLEVRGSLRTYLYTSVRNQAISHLRRSIVERRWLGQAQLTGATVANDYTFDDPQARLESNELSAAILGVIERLPERCRLACTLRLERQMSYGEIADAMQISIKTVEVYIGRGLEVLRRHAESLRIHR